MISNLILTLNKHNLADVSKQIVINSELRILVKFQLRKAYKTIPSMNKGFSFVAYL